MADVANKTVTKDDLFKAILRYENAGEPENAAKVREILNRNFPNAQNEISIKEPELAPYPYSEEQIRMNKENIQNRALGNATLADESRTTENQQVLGENMGGAVAASFLSGGLGFGESVDEAIGVIGGDDKKEQVRRLQMAFEEEYPKTNMALRMAGGVVSTIPIGAMAGTQKLYSFLASLPKRYKYPLGMTAGGLFGLTEGFAGGAGIQGEGETGGASNRFENAVKESLSSGLWGTLGAGFGHALTDVGTAAWVSIKDGLRNKTIKQIKEIFNLKSGKTAEIIKQTTQDSSLSFNDLMENLRKGGADGQIPDADDAMSTLLDTIQIQGGEGASIVRNTVADRANRQLRGTEAALDRKAGKLDTNEQGIKMDAKDMADDIAKSSAPARSKAYTNAYNQKINYNSPDGVEILKILDKIQKGSPDVMQAAMKKANARLAWDEKDLGQSSFQIGEDGLFKMVNNPNMLQLDYLKRAIGELAYEMPDVMKKSGLKDAPDAVLFSSMYTTLNKALKNVNKPEKGDSLYAKATQLGQDKIQRSNAIGIGEQVLNPKYSANDISRVMLDAGDAEKQMAKFGFRSSIEENLNNVKKTINSPEIDVNKVNALLKTMSTDNVKAKMEIILGVKETKSLLKTFEMAETALSLRAAVAKGSQSAQRIIASQKISSIVDDTIGGAVADIAPLRTGQLLAQRVLKSRVISDRRKDLIMKELANALLGTKGAAARQQFKALYQAVKNGQASDEQMLKVAQLLASKITIAPVTVTTNTMSDTELDADIMLGASNLLQREQ